MSKPSVEAFTPKNITGSTQISAASGKLGGIFVASSTSGTLKVWDSKTAAGTVIANTFSAAAGTFYRIPARFQNGLFVTTGGTIDCTVFYE